jgi:hypothetical protein
MTCFTDSVYEKMMVQKPIYGQEKISPVHKNTMPQKQKKIYRNLIIKKQNLLNRENFAFIYRLSGRGNIQPQNLLS